MEAPGIGRNTADIFALIQALFYRLGQEQVTRMCKADIEIYGDVSQ